MRRLPRALLLLALPLLAASQATPSHAAPGPAPCPQADARADPDGTVTLRWTPAPGAASYRILRAEVGGGEREVGLVLAPGTTFHDATTSPGATYRYRVVPDEVPPEAVEACPAAEVTAIPYVHGLATALTVAGVAALGYLLVVGTRRAPVAHHRGGAARAAPEKRG